MAQSCLDSDEPGGEFVLDLLEHARIAISPEGINSETSSDRTLPQFVPKTLVVLLQSFQTTAPASWRINLTVPTMG